MIATITTTNMKTEFINCPTVVTIGDWVERVGSAKDYTTGRKGVIVEINADRLRVRWYFEKSGAKVFQGNIEPKNWKGIRTWVNKKWLTPTTKPGNF